MIDTALLAVMVGCIVTLTLGVLWLVYRMDTLTAASLEAIDRLTLADPCTDCDETDPKSDGSLTPNSDDTPGGDTTGL